MLDLGKGHAEHLMAVIEPALAAGAELSGSWRCRRVGRPGSFTGVRVGVSAARGFALALKIPAIGVSTLEAVAAEAAKIAPEPDGGSTPAGETSRPHFTINSAMPCMVRL